MAQAVDSNEVSPGFFQALNIPLVRGRAIDDRDRPCSTGPCSVVVSEALVRQLLPSGDPIGRKLQSRTGTIFEVVGVARDTSMDEAGRTDPPLVYLPWVPDGRPYQALVRFTGDGGRFARAATETLRAEVSRRHRRCAHAAVDAQPVARRIREDRRAGRGAGRHVDSPGGHGRVRRRVVRGEPPGTRAGCAHRTGSQRARYLRHGSRGRASPGGRGDSSAEWRWR